MKKIGIALVSLGLVAATLFLLSPKEEEVFTTVERLPVVEVALPDRYTPSPWIFRALVCGQERTFEVYPWIIRALIDDHRVAMNLTDCFEVSDDDVRSFEYIGKTEEGVHLLLAYDKGKSHLLFVEILKSQGATLHGDLDPYRRELQDGKFVFYEDQVLIKKIGKIALPGLWFEKGDEFGWNKRFALEGNTLIIESSVFVLDLTPPSLPRLIKKEVPYHWDARPYINPYLLWGFLSNWHTGGTVNIAYDLVKAQNHPGYNCLGMGLTSNPSGYFSYIYKGMTSNGVHIVKTIYDEANPTDIRHLLLGFEEDYELNVDWDAQMITRDKKSILIKKIGELELNLSEPLVLKENTISYTEMYWENKPYAITGSVECEEFIYEIEL